MSDSDQSKTNIFEEKPDHHWRTEIPNIIWDLGLKQGERDLYSYYKKVAGDGGHCDTSNATIQKVLDMSPNTIKKNRDGLNKKHELLGGKSLITSIEGRLRPEGDPDTVYVQIVNVWRENGDNERRKAEERIKKQNRGTSIVEGGVSQKLRGGISKVEHKEEPPKKNLKKNNNKTPSEAASPVVVFSIFKELEIPDSLKAKLSSQMNEEKATLLVQRVKAWTGRGSDAIGCNTILSQWETWEDNIPKEDVEDNNREYLKSMMVHDGKKCGHYQFEISPTCFLFRHSRTDGTRDVCFKAEESGMINSIKAMINKATETKTA